jgi:chromosome segregation ATPase
MTLSKDDHLEQKLRESMNNERKLTDELLSTRKEFEQKQADYQKRIEEEKEKARSKVQKLEQLFKEGENKRNMMIFEHEKEKSKWNVENGQLISQQHDYLEQIDHLKQKKEALTRENDKIANELKQLKRSTTGISGVYGSIGQGIARMDRSYVKNEEGSKKNSVLGEKGSIQDMKLSDNILDKFGDK